MMIHVLRWLAVLVLAFTVGKLITKIKMPSILGWLIVGMLFGPHALRLLPQDVLTAGWYQTIVMWMQCAASVCSSNAPIESRKAVGVMPSRSGYPVIS